MAVWGILHKPYQCARSVQLFIDSPVCEHSKQDPKETKDSANLLLKSIYLLQTRNEESRRSLVKCDTVTTRPIFLI